MRSGAFEVQAIAGTKNIVLATVQPNFKFTAHDVEKFFTFMGIGFTTAAAGFDAEKMRLHGGIAPGEKLHADVGTGFEDLALRGPNEVLGVTVCFEQRDYIGFVKTGNAAERGDGRAHLSAFEGAEKTDGDAGGPSNLREREAALGAQTAEALAGKLSSIGWRGNDALFFEDVNDSGGIKSTRSAKKQSALQEAHIGFGIHAVAALGALRRDQAKSFPGAQRGRRDAQAAGHLGDAQETLRRQRFR